MSDYGIYDYLMETVGIEKMGILLILVMFGVSVFILWRWAYSDV